MAPKAPSRSCACSPAAGSRTPRPRSRTTTGWSSSARSRSRASRKRCWVIRRRVVRAPASSANLGPGFDCMAAALALHLELEVAETGSFAVETDLAVARGRENLCVRAFELLHPADGFTFRINSQIPLAGGLGSSAAAIVAGLIAADPLFELDADVRAPATALAGHPDSGAAALR